jgi:hypothetical protein
MANKRDVSALVVAAVLHIQCGSSTTKHPLHPAEKSAAAASSSSGPPAKTPQPDPHPECRDIDIADNRVVVATHLVGVAGAFTAPLRYSKVLALRDKLKDYSYAIKEETTHKLGEPFPLNIGDCSAQVIACPAGQHVIVYVDSKCGWYAGRVILDLGAPQIPFAIIHFPNVAAVGMMLDASW